VTEAFRSPPGHHRRRILVITKDVLTERMAGPAIRAWHIAEHLAQGHDVHLATLSPLCTVVSDAFSTGCADAAAVERLERWCDIIILQGFTLIEAPALQLSSKLIVVDLYDPLQLETLELMKREPRALRDAQLSMADFELGQQLRRGDFFMCASGKQRDFWLGQLVVLGRVNSDTYDADPTLRKLIDVVPFGLPDQNPKHERPVLRGVIPGIDDDSEILIWAGGIYNWFDPLTLIHAVDILRRERPTLRLFFMGLSHPNPEVPAMQMAVSAQRLARRLGLLDRHVFFNEGWVSYEERQNYLLEADVGVSTHFEHAETAFSFRTRILDYLWCRLPILSTEGDAFADLVAQEGLGLVVPPEDVDAVCDGLRTLLAKPSTAEDCRANIDRLRSSYRWSMALAPLAQYCANPRRAADHPRPLRSRRYVPTTVRSLRPLPTWVKADLRAVARRVLAYLRAVR
jgi:glycosyltransferase involved in cell wall biosynthesis